VVHVADHDGAVPGGGDGAADFLGSERGAAVAVDAEGDDALAEVFDDAYRDVVAVRGP
jgi:hypothetical protein